MFVNLDGAWGFQYVFVIGYRFTDDAGELWTRRFNAFKAGEERAVRAGIAVMRAALRNVQKPPEPMVVIGVPGSKEKQLDAGQPVARLAESVADFWGAKLDLKLVEKNPHQPIHRKGSIDARQQLLDEAKHRTVRSHKTVPSYVLIDDFVTRGDTMNRIADAIRKDVPKATFTAVAMCKTERLQFWAERGKPAPDNREAAAFEALWTKVYEGK